MDAEAVTMEGVELLGISIGGLDISCYAVEPAPASQNQVNHRLDDVFTVTLCYQDDQIRNERRLTFTLPIETEDGFDVLPDIRRELDTVHANPRVYYGVANVVAENCGVLRQEVLDSGRTSLAMVVKIRVRGFRFRVHYDVFYGDTYEEDGDEEAIAVASSEEVKNLLSNNGGVKFVRGDQISSMNMECCSICLEEFRKQEKNNHDCVAVLPCSHIFHEDCLVPWIAQGKNTCPFCRFKLLHETVLSCN